MLGMGEVGLRIHVSHRELVVNTDRSCYISSESGSEYKCSEFGLPFAFGKINI
jgi:hypothetical protein